MSCKAVANREAKAKGKPTIEFCINGKPQYYCMGIIDNSTEGILQTCVKCKQYVGKAQEDIKHF